MDKLNIALDWYPNIIHVGMLLAQSEGFYAEQGLEVTLLDVKEDGYTCYPLDKLIEGRAQIALAPTEHLFYKQQHGHPDLVAIGAVTTRDHSAVAYKAVGPIKSPKDLDGKRIACYGTYFEIEIYKAIIQADGGRGVFEPIHPGKLALWETFINGQADACWMFPCWEGALAKAAGIELNYFRLPEHGVPYGQSPIFIAKNSLDQSVKERFKAATAKGYHLLVTNPDQALELIANTRNQSEAERRVWELASQTIIADLLDSNGTWGAYNQEVAQNWSLWLDRNNLWDAVAH